MSSIRRFRIALALPLALAALTAGAAYGADFDWSWDLESGQTIEIRGINGSIEVRPANGERARVVATKEGRRCDPDRVRIEAVEGDEGVIICALYPAVDGRENECDTRPHGRLSNKDCDVTVDFVAYVPEGVRFVGQTVNGEVRADGLSAPSDLSTVNGSIRLRSTSVASATTVNGSIEAELGESDWGEPMTFQSVNGSIRVTIPAGVSADVRGEVMNGQLRTEFPIEVVGRWGPRRLRGQIGDGGPDLELHTLNGNIALLRGD